MSNSRDEIFGFLGREFSKGIVGSKGSNEGGSLKEVVVFIGLLAFAGYEGAKVMFRKNFGMTRLAWVRLAVCIFCFIGLSVTSFVISNSTEEFAVRAASPTGHLVAGVFFALAALAILIRGITGVNRKIKEEYGGESTLLSFLLKDGWSKKRVQNVAEPILILALGIGFSAFNLIAGTALAFCALSIWGNLAFEALFPSRSSHDEIKELNRGHMIKPVFKRARPE